MISMFCGLFLICFCICFCISLISNIYFICFLYCFQNVIFTQTIVELNVILKSVISYALHFVCEQHWRWFNCVLNDNSQLLSLTLPNTFLHPIRLYTPDDELLALKPIVWPKVNDSEKKAIDLKGGIERKTKF